MPIEIHGEPGLGATYHGFSRPAPQRAARPMLTRERLIGGACAAVALGAAVAIWASPQQARELDALHVSTPTPAVAGQGVNILLNPPPAPAPVKSGAPLEVLPADMAAAAPKPHSMADLEADAPQAPEPPTHVRFTSSAGPRDAPYDEPPARPAPPEIAPPPEAYAPAWYGHEPMAEPPAGY